MYTTYFGHDDPSSFLDCSGDLPPINYIDEAYNGFVGFHIFWIKFECFAADQKYRTAFVYIRRFCKMSIYSAVSEVLLALKPKNFKTPTFAFSIFHRVALKLFYTISVVQQEYYHKVDTVSRRCIKRSRGGKNCFTGLFVNSHNCGCPWLCDTQIFSRYGKVLKIVTFTKNNSFQVLIQYPDVVTAQSAKLSLDGQNLFHTGHLFDLSHLNNSLDGQNIYTSCCKLRIEYSKLSSLNVKYNNDKSRDYTNPTLPNGDNTVMETLAALGVDSVAGNQLLPHQLSLLLSGVPSAAAGLPQARRQLTTGADHSRLAGSPGMLTPSFNAVHGLASPLATSYANSPVTSMPLGFTLPGGSLATGTLRLPGQMTGQTCVLLVSNLNEEMVTPDAIFTLFGVYGDVLRVKILYNKKDGALVQMAEPHQAHLAMLHLDKVRLYGKYIRVMQSKYQTVQLPKEGQPDSGLTKDYTSSPLHRFKKPGSKNYQNIYPPSSTLHLSNIPTTLSEDFLKTAFENNTFTVKDFKFFPKDRKMALIQMESLEDAVAALIKMHNYRLSEQNHLRVSFSKSNIQPDTLTPN
ncbi:hypothetical protein AGLY_001446 [Aphis glycines]|uniref:RRM domain-containing protein n=1 Tax=Aphis glycines TaxID=307491 RepID=A0A6G0U5N9_APHGL|nr:hypothetical protein AGLY_001446 [Aphis glycines]